MTDTTDDIPTLPVCMPADAIEPLAGGAVLARAPAKLNLALRVGPVRADGFHPLDSVVAKITLYDELEFTPRDDGGVRLHCQEASLGAADENLVMRAARAITTLRSTSRPRGGGAGVDIVLRKHIPAGAGLGGGSADAAVTLRVLNEMWNCRLAPAQLAEIAATLGSDVPLMLGPPTARMRGRGEILEPLAINPFRAILVTPPVHCPTAPVYAAYDESPKALTEPDLAVFTDRPATDWTDAVVNDLFAPACRVCPRIAEWVDAVAAATGEPVHMTGSGSALFILAADVQAALAIGRRLTPALAAAARIVSLNPW